MWWLSLLLDKGLIVQANPLESEPTEVSDRPNFSSGEHVVLSLGGFEHLPHAPHIVRRISPVPLGLEIRQSKSFLKPRPDSRDGGSDLAGDELFTSSRAFMIVE